MKLRSCLTACLLLPVILLSAQDTTKLSTWAQVEKAISVKKKLPEAQIAIYTFREKAIAEHDDISLARSYYYEMILKDVRTEDTLFLKNASFIDSFLEDQHSSAVLKLIMHVLKAQRLDKFQRWYARRNNAFLFRAKDKIHAYQELKEDALKELVAQDLKEALIISYELKVIDPQELLWLCHDPLLFFFKPGIPDIIYAEKLYSVQTEFPYLRGEINNGKWMMYSPDTFMNRLDSIQLYFPAFVKTISAYKEWYNYKRVKEPEAAAYIETLARLFLHNKSNEDQTSQSYFEKYIQQLTISSYSSVRVQGIYQQFLLLQSQAGKYSPLSDNGYAGSQPFDSTYRMYNVNAISLYEKNASLLDSFPNIKKEMAGKIEIIQMPLLKVQLDDAFSPAKPILLYVHYKNAAKLYVRWIKGNAFNNYPGSRNIFRDEELVLKDYHDYQHHAMYLQCPALPAGEYQVMFSDKPFADSIGSGDKQTVNVTDIAVVNNEDRIYVLNRETGFPVQQARIKVYYENHSAKPIEHRLNENGSFILQRKKKINYIEITNGKDSIEYFPRDIDKYTPGGIYTKEEFDDMEEYYEDNTTVHFFTDRPVYRPGQTVHYKGILLTRDPFTGESLMLNWKNLHLPFFKKLFARLLVKFSKRKLEFYINDPFNKTADTIRVIPNQFGSFAGSFTIPKNASTGEWKFEGDIIEVDNYREGRFNVEEYKRPSFDITIEKPKKELRLGDPFSFLVKVKSFAGVALGNTQIKYSIERSGDIPKEYQQLGSDYNYRVITVHDTIGYTNDKGELEVTVNDTLLKHILFPTAQKWEIDYRIDVQGVDNTGESHTKDERVGISTRPIIISVNSIAQMDRHEMVPLFLSTRHELAGKVIRDLSIRVYRVTDKISYQFYNRPVDSWVIDRNVLKDLYPMVDFDTAAVAEKKLVWEKQLKAGEPLKLPEDLIEAGSYMIEVVCYEQGIITGLVQKSIDIFDKTKGEYAGKPNADFNSLAVNTASKGETLTWYTGNKLQDIFSIYTLTYFPKSKKGKSTTYIYDTRTEKKGINPWRFTIPDAAGGQLCLTHIYILHNHQYKQTRQLYILGGSTVPEIIVEHYRKQMAPGAKETFTVSVKTNNENIAAELMTTMYDASLDKIADNTWEIPQNRNYYYVRENWSNSITYNMEASVYNEIHYKTNNSNTLDGGKRLWWMKEGYIIKGTLVLPSNLLRGSMEEALEGKVAGLTILGDQNLNEVVVVGYGASKKDLTGAMMLSVRGNASLKSYANLRVVLDGTLYKGDISKMNTDSFSQVMILKGADAVALYGSEAANGIIIISTKGEIQFPALPPAPVPVVRKNFDESAFFFPQVYAGTDGYYSFSFTVSESVTEWKWKMLAHTKNAKFAYAEKSIFTQLPLMVQPNLPRFLYQGDTIQIKSRISNLDTVSANGKIKCSVEDLVTGEDITTQLIGIHEKTFSAAASTTTAPEFTLAVPVNFLHPLKIKITAGTGSYADGEEHVLPILSKKMMAVATAPFELGAGKTISISHPALPADAVLYGTGMYINPLPTAGMVNALPSLAFYPYNCAEQTFNKMLAHIVANNIVRREKIHQSDFEPEEENTAMPDGLDAGQMPWIDLGHANHMQQQQLLQLFDTLEGKRKIEKYVDELLALQQADGGMSWFKGGKSDYYISNYLLAGFGELKKEGLIVFPAKEDFSKQDKIIGRLVVYCDSMFLDNWKRYGFLTDQLSYLYARSFWINEYPLALEQLAQVKNIINGLWQKMDGYDISNQATICIISERYIDKEFSFVDKAKQQMKFLDERAIKDEAHGVRWKELGDQPDLNITSQEIITRVASAFEEEGGYDETVNGIIKWLLGERKDYNWGTTKSTAGIILLLGRRKVKLTDNAVVLRAMAGDSSMTVSDDVLGGNLFAFRPSAGAHTTGDVKVQNKSAIAGATGGINDYYFTEQPVADKGSKVILEKTINYYNTVSKAWQPVIAGTVLHIGDKLETTLHIRSEIKLRYVLVEEKHSAAAEPTDVLSGYDYSSSFRYYKSVRDIGSQFFMEEVPAGDSYIKYETVVNATGTFTDAFAQLQCMYSPGVKAYSKNQVITVR